MQGIFINFRRPKSKKEIKEFVSDPAKRSGVAFEATSMFGNEFAGSVTQMPIGQKIMFVGPDPFRKRSFYGSITRKSETEFKVE